MDKSYVTLALCPICQKENGSLLMDRRLRKSFEMHTIDPRGVCDKCKEKYLAKGVMLFSTETGDLVVLKDSAYKRLFNKPLPKYKIAFCDQEVLEHLNNLNKTK